MWMWPRPRPHGFPPRQGFVLLRGSKTFLWQNRKYDSRYKPTG